MKRILVTGATGFVGRNCLPLLEQRGFEVHGVSSGGTEHPVSSVIWHKADLLNELDQASLMEKIKATHILHFAWNVKPGVYLRSMENLRWLKASLNLLELFVLHSGQRIVMAGTCFEYDRRYGYCIENFTPLSSPDAYGVCKQSLGSILESLSRTAGLSSAWGRIFFLYGPHENPNRLVSGAIGHLLKGSLFPCSHGRQIRDFLHVQDVANAFVALLDSDVQGPVNIASGIPVPVSDVISRVADKLDRCDLIRWGAVPLGPNEAPLIVADVRRLRNEVRWEPQYDLDSGLDQTIGWWRKQILEGNQ